MMAQTDLEVGTTDHFCDPVHLNWIIIATGSERPIILDVTGHEENSSFEGT